MLNSEMKHSLLGRPYMFNFICARKFISCFFTFLFFFVYIGDANVHAAETIEVASISSVYYSSDNSVTRRTALRSLNSIAVEEGKKAPQWVSELLGDALNDKSPVVVATAVKQIGRFKLIEYNTDLVHLFQNADQRFGASGYTHRVQYAVIPALGMLNTAEAKQLVAELLRSDNGSAMGQYLLSAILSFNDPAFLNDVKIYKHKMNSAVVASREKGDDPILYSRKLGYIELAITVEKALLTKGGK